MANAVAIEQLYPIVLSNFNMKIIAKILADRLALITTRIISCQQFGFLKNKSISDCISGASEGVNLLQKTYFRGNMAIKIDIRKAFNTMDWDFSFRCAGSFQFFFVV